MSNQTVNDEGTQEELKGDAKIDNSEIENQENENLESKDQGEAEAHEATSEKDSEVYKEKYLYLAAEMENLKRRFDRERSQTIKFGTEGVLKDMVDVLDNFDLMLNALRFDQDEKMKNVVFGIDMVRDKFMSALSGHGLKVIETKDREFDPNFHEAVAQEYAEGKENMIIREEARGYELNGRLLRASKVTVSTNKKQ